MSTTTYPRLEEGRADDAGIFSFFPEFGLVAYDFDGRERWRHELPPFRSFYGLAASPIVDRGVLVLWKHTGIVSRPTALILSTAPQVWILRRLAATESSESS